MLARLGVIKPTGWPGPVLGLAILGVLLGFLYWDGLVFAAEVWFESPEYSHGVMIPFIALFLVWQQKERLRTLVLNPTWLGPTLLLLGLALNLLGKLSALYILIHYSLIVVLAGLVLSYWGPGGLRLLGMPLLFLVLMIPLPNILYKGLSSELQLLSSQLGVSLIRLFGISVFLEGNVIDFGKMKLEVVEACNGLRYMFPLMTVGFILAYFFRAPWWQRVLIFLSSIPVTVLMNSLRIGIIGVMVEYWGPAMAEGFLHDFEGWLVFMASCAILLLEMAVFARVNGYRLRQTLSISSPTPSSVSSTPLILGKPIISCGMLIIMAVMLHIFVSTRADVVPSRSMFTQFPLEISDWRGHQSAIDQEYIDVLKFDDYLMADYVHPPLEAVNLYIAYYATQRAGQSTHSPRTCIPGGGWEIESLDQRTLRMSTPGKTLDVNRVLIRKGEERQLVYYWFQQRGRVVTNEYAVKWYLLWDAITRHRTDGALMRLTTRIPPMQDVAVAESQLNGFAEKMLSQLPRYVPN